MNRYTILGEKKDKGLLALTLFLLLYLCRDTNFSNAILGVDRAVVLTAALVCCLGLVFLLRNRSHWKQILLDRRLLPAAVYVLVFLIPMIAKRDWQMMYFSMILCLLIGVFMTYVSSWRELAKYYVVILTVLGLYSMVATYGLRLLPDQGILSVPVFRNSAGHEFHNFGLAFVSDEFVKDRNFGIFREPGIYQYFIILALVLNNYSITWERPWKLWFVNVALAFTMVTTFATGGVAELGLLVLVVFFDKKLYKDKLARIVAAIVVVGAVVVIGISIIRKNALYWALWDMIVWKLMMNSDSASDRTMSLILNWDLFLKSPLLGAKLSDALYALHNNTSSTTILMAGCGIGATLVHVAAWLAMIWEKGRKLWVNLALVLILFVAFNTQNMIAELFFWLFPIMALTEKVTLWLESRKNV